MSSTSLILSVLFLLLPGSCGFQAQFLTHPLSNNEDSRRRHSSVHPSTQCAPLANMESYFSVSIKVGTPGQKFAVVADTGSDAVIIPSCACRDSGNCDEDAKCFRGTNKSSTFYMSKNGSAAKDGVPMVQMSFGSGDVEAVIASDMVDVGGVTTMMKDGVLLMVQNQLQIEDAGGFQGILGLGPPKNETLLALEAAKQQKEMEKAQKAMEKQQKALEKAMKKRKGDAGQDGDDPMDGVPLDEIVKSKTSGQEGGGEPQEGSGMSRMPESKDGAAIVKAIAGMKEGADEETLKEMGDLVRAAISSRARVEALSVPSWRPQHTETLGATSFLESAGVSRFSICFRDQGRSGALRLQPPKADASLESVGTNHWGVDFQGISVGDASAKVKFCSPDSKAKGQDTACGGIPDSGTTLLMAPKSQIEPLFEDLCDNWERCRKVVDEGLGKVKSEIFQLLLSECSEWRQDGEGFDELPPMYLHVAGADGTKQTLRLDATSYIFETLEQEVEEVAGSAQGLSMPVPTGKNRTVCMPAISGHDMETQLNGPVWILGSPLFYQYSVAYNLDRTHFKSSLSFEELEGDGDACGCQDAKDDALALSERGPVERRPRALHGPPRVSRIDVSLGL